ncbi:MAG: tRNA (cytidine(34)-2'-O)-methyltransferase [Parvularculaceae bacterium]
MRLALYQPEIAGNAGAAIRAAACFGAGVDIIEPCGFPPDARALRRAALDYGALAPPRLHASWAAFCQRPERLSGRLILLSTKAAVPLWDCQFHQPDIVMIGQESAGVPDAVRDACDLAVRIPIADGARSLNAAAAAAIALAEARRQTGWRGAAK